METDPENGRGRRGREEKREMDTERENHGSNEAGRIGLGGWDSLLQLSITGAAQLSLIQDRCSVSLSECRKSFLS